MDNQKLEKELNHWQNKAQSLALKSLRCLDCEKEVRETYFGLEKERELFQQRGLLCWPCKKKSQ